MPKLVMPTLRDVHREYADNEDKIAELKAKLRLAEMEAAPLRELVKKVSQGDAEQSDRVARLLGSDSNQGNSVAQDRSRLIQLEQEIKDIDIALGVVNGALAKAKHVASVKVCKEIEPEHRRRAAAICNKMIELHSAVAAYHELADAINHGGVQWGFTPVHPHRIGHPNDRSSYIATYLGEAVQLGNFAAEDVPAAIQNSVVQVALRNKNPKAKKNG
jgi:hypothetical protein